MKVLVVDDDPEILLISSFLLTNGGDDVVTAASADDAELALKTSSFDAVLMDVMLGDDDGIDVAARLLPPSPGAPALIFLTAATRAEQVARMNETNARGIVHKPFDPEGFVPRIRALLQGDVA